MAPSPLQFPEAPLYVKPALRSSVGKLSDRMALATQEFWQVHLSCLYERQGLQRVYAELFAQQRDAGFVPTWADSIGWCRLHASDASAYWLVSLVEKRSGRGTGAGRPGLPLGAEVAGVPPDCHLCFWNVLLRQCGVQIPWVTRLGRDPWILLASPFPFGAEHATVATREHLSQDWRQGGIAVDDIVAAMVDMTMGLGVGYMTGWNGYGAANSLDHCHFHALRVPLDDELPIQVAARRTGATGVISVIDDTTAFPLLAIRFAGQRDDLVANVARCVKGWHAFVGPDATESLVVVVENGGPVAFFVPRDRRVACSHALSTGFGFMEAAAGALVAGDASDRAPFRSLTFDSVFQALMALRLRTASDFVRKTGLV